MNEFKPNTCIVCIACYKTSFSKRLVMSPRQVKCLHVFITCLLTLRPHLPGLHHSIYPSLTCREEMITTSRKRGQH